MFKIINLIQTRLKRGLSLVVALLLLFQCSAPAVAAASRPTSHSRLEPASPPRTRIIHVRDIHESPRAQFEIAKILKSLNPAGAYPVFVEGTAAPLVFDDFKSVPDPDLLQRAATGAVNAGVISGPAYLAMTEPSTYGRLHGIEDQALYDLNSAMMSEATLTAPRLKVRLESIEHRLSILKKETFNSDLARLDALYTELGQDDLNLSTLIQLIGDPDLPVSASVQRLLSVWRDIQRIDPHRLRNERAIFLSRLAGELPNLASDDDISTFFLFRSDLKSEFPLLFSYARLHRELKALDIAVLLTGLLRAAEDRLGLLAQSTHEQAGLLLSRRLHLMSKALDLKLRPEEWTALTSLATDVIPFSDRRLAALYEESRTVLAGMQPHLDFYRYASLRNQAFSRSIHEQLNGGSAMPPIALVVAGGFHSGMAEYLVAQGYGYMAVDASPGSNVTAQLAPPPLQTGALQKILLPFLSSSNDENRSWAERLLEERGLSGREVARLKTSPRRWKWAVFTSPFVAIWRHLVFLKARTLIWIADKIGQERDPIVFKGKGLFGKATGDKPVTMTIFIKKPNSNYGVRFIRTDLQGQMGPRGSRQDVDRRTVHVHVDNLKENTLRQSCLMNQDNVKITMPEHILSALGELGIWDAEIHIDGEEVPALDGSAVPYYERLRAHAVDRSGKDEEHRIASPMGFFRDENTALWALPLPPRTRAYREIHSVVNLKNLPSDRGLYYDRWIDTGPLSYAEEADQKTFAEDLRGLQIRGYFKNAIPGQNIIDVQNDPNFRARDAAVHKARVDFPGDLAVLEISLRKRVKGAFYLIGTGHRDNAELVRMIYESIKEHHFPVFQFEQARQVIQEQLSKKHITSDIAAAMFAALDPWAVLPPPKRKREGDGLKINHRALSALTDTLRFDTSRYGSDWKVAPVAKGNEPVVGFSESLRLINEALTDFRRPFIRSLWARFLKDWTPDQFKEIVVRPWSEGEGYRQGVFRLTFVRIGSEPPIHVGLVVGKVFSRKLTEELRNAHDALGAAAAANPKFYAETGPFTRMEWDAREPVGIFSREWVEGWTDQLTATIAAPDGNLAQGQLVWSVRETGFGHDNEPRKLRDAEVQYLAESFGHKLAGDFLNLRPGPLSKQRRIMTYFNFGSDLRLDPKTGSVVIARARRAVGVDVDQFIHALLRTSYVRYENVGGTEIRHEWPLFTEPNQIEALLDGMRTGMIDSRKSTADLRQIVKDLIGLYSAFRATMLSPETFKYEPTDEVGKVVRYRRSVKDDDVYRVVEVGLAPDAHVLKKIVSMRLHGLGQDLAALDAFHVQRERFETAFRAALENKDPEKLESWYKERRDRGGNFLLQNREGVLKNFLGAEWTPRRQAEIEMSWQLLLERNQEVQERLGVSALLQRIAQPPPIVENLGEVKPLASARWLTLLLVQLFGGTEVAWVKRSVSTEALVFGGLGLSLLSALDSLGIGLAGTGLAAAATFLVWTGSHQSIWISRGRFTPLEFVPAAAVPKLARKVYLMGFVVAVAPVLVFDAGGLMAGISAVILATFVHDWFNSPAFSELLPAESRSGNGPNPVDRRRTFSAA